MEEAAGGLAIVPDKTGVCFCSAVMGMVSAPNPETSRLICGALCQMTAYKLTMTACTCIFGLFVYYKLLRAEKGCIHPV